MKTNITNKDSDTIIIGGGLAGLAAATYLARAGQGVTLFEKSSTLGGRAATHHHNGFHLNLGAHALYARSEAASVLKELGVQYTGGKPRNVLAVSGGEVHTFPTGPLSLMRSGVLKPAAKYEATRLLIKLQGMNPDDFEDVTLQEWLESATADPVIRRFIEAASRVGTYTSAPHALSLSLVIIQTKAALRGGAVYIDGGWQTLVDGLRRAAEAAGVKIVTGARVEAVEHKSGTVTGVRLHDGSHYPAAAVVIAAGPRDASDLVDHGAHPSLNAWTEQAVPVQAACLDIALRKLPRPDRPVVIGIDRPLFLTAQSVYAGVAPEGGAVVHTLKYLDPEQPSSPEDDRRELEAWLDFIQPGWREEVVERRFLPHLAVTHAMVSARQGGFAGRPGPLVPGITGLYVAGDWVGPRGALSGVSLASAREAAHAIIRSSGRVAFQQAA